MLWSVGNGLTTGTFVTYLALDMGAHGMGLSLILAVPTLLGVLRLFASPLINWLGTTKRSAVIFFSISYLLFWGVPLVAIPGVAPRHNALFLLIAITSVHQLFEYMGQIALWSWLADIVPSTLRGRYFGRRQVLQLAVLIPTLILGSWFTDQWRTHYRSEPDRLLLGYAMSSGLGALFLLSSIWPLVRMPATPQLTGNFQRLADLILVAIRDTRFRRLLQYGCWCSVFNGITQAPQNIFPKRILHLDIWPLSLMRIGMQVGQMGFSAWAGQFSDRFGNRLTLIISQMMLATAPIFFLLSTPDQPWLIAGAWLAWSAYAGVNVCGPNLMLKLASRQQVASYLALYFALTSLFYAASTVAGGYCFDRFLRADGGSVLWQLDAYQVAFLAALIGRFAAVLFLFRLIEPAPGSTTLAIVPLSPERVNRSKSFRPV